MTENYLSRAMIDYSLLTSYVMKTSAQSAYLL